MTPQELAGIVDLINTGVFPEGKIVEYRPILDAANARTNRADREARRACVEIVRTRRTHKMVEERGAYGAIINAILTTIKEPR